MKRDFSFYEFAGILVPGVVCVFVINLIAEVVYARQMLDYSTLGETVIAVVLAYAAGHILHALGNLYEQIFWWALGGMPTYWINQKNSFGNFLLPEETRQMVLQKLHHQFHVHTEHDYGVDVYGFLSSKPGVTEKRIDIFSANYSLFRGLTITFYLVGLIALVYLSSKIAIVLLGCGFLANFRMVRFSKLYAKEIFRTYLNQT